MALQRPISKALACNSCQRWILRSFISGLSGQTIHHPTLNPVQRRPFSRTTRRWNESRERIQKDEKDEHPLNDINDEVARISLHDAEPIPEEPAQEHVPWYLQVQQPIQQSDSPLAARQRLPDLPEHPPSLLQPLLEHVSIELGMDDLSLLDLRSLDPPPALGANLLMIVGTARSEKHLHVSADRLCRWLRTQYKLSPYADGLLGRNELKLKMRRKAKRSRLLSAVGAKATADTEIDDGIRTGWVCVNVGRVEGGELPEQQEKSQRTDDIVGFGTRTGGSNIVVQMMTEEKRGEIDLENLWTDIMSQAKKESKQAVEASATISEPEESYVSSQAKEFPSSARYFPEAPVSTHTAGQQVRAYHTLARRQLATAPAPTISRADYMPKYDPLPRPTVDATDPSISTLVNLLSDLKSMDSQRALDVLGDDLGIASPRLSLDTFNVADTLLDEQVGVSKKSFLDNFYGAMPAFPGLEHWHLHIELLAHARRLGHHQAHSNVLVAQLMNMQIAGLIPVERTFKLVVQSALAPLGNVKLYDGTNRNPSDGKMRSILAVLEDMEGCGYDPVSPDILEMLHLACVGPAQPQSKFELGTVLRSLKAASLRRHAQAGDWPSFWRTWRSYPQRFLPRTAEMYEVLFTAIGNGELEDTREARDVIRTFLPEMEREEPPVVLEEHSNVAEAAMRALEHIEPRLKEPRLKEPRLKEPTHDAHVNNEWKGWHERCLGVLGRTRWRH